MKSTTWRLLIVDLQCERYVRTQHAVLNCLVHLQSVETITPRARRKEVVVLIRCAN